MKTTQANSPEKGYIEPRVDRASRMIKKNISQTCSTGTGRALFISECFQNQIKKLKDYDNDLENYFTNISRFLRFMSNLNFLSNRHKKYLKVDNLTEKFFNKALTFFTNNSKKPKERVLNTEQFFREEFRFGFERKEFYNRMVVEASKNKKKKTKILRENRDYIINEILTDENTCWI